MHDSYWPQKGALNFENTRRNTNKNSETSNLMKINYSHNRLTGASRFFVMCLFGVTAGLINTPSAWSQPYSQPRNDFWFPDGPVYSILITNKTVYFGGKFAYVGPQTARAALFDVGSGESLSAVPPVNGPVYAVESDGAGGWFLGGQFTQVGGVTITNLVHLRPDLSVDARWDAKIVGTAVNALAKSAGLLYVAGQYQMIGGVRRGFLAAVNQASGGLANWNPEMGGAVYALVVTNGLAYVGGQFSSVGTSNRAYIAAIDLGTGKAANWNPTADQTVRALAVAGNVVYAGGQFTSIGTKPRNRLAALDATTGQATTWNPNPNGVVLALVVTDTDVYVGGDFTTISVANRTGFAAIKRSNGAAQPLNLQLEGTTQYPVRAIQLVGNTLYVAGSFSKVQGVLHPLVTAVDLATGQVISRAPLGTEYYGGTRSAGVWAIGATSTDILFGGEFLSLGGNPRRNLAALSAETGKLLPWVADASDTVYALAFGADRVFAGGAFTNINQTPIFALAALDPGTGALIEEFAFVATNTYANPVVRSLISTEGRLYLGGLFTAIGGKTARGLSAVHPGSAAPFGFAPDVWGGSQGVMALALRDTTLYLGGDFSQVGGQTRYRLAAVSTEDGKLLDWDPAPSQDVKTLCLQGDRLYVGGTFRKMGTIEIHFLALFEVPSMDLLPMDAALSQNASSVEVINALDTAVYVGGYFDGIGGEYRQNAAVLGPFTAQAFEWDPAPVYHPPVAIAISDSLVCIGGSFADLGRAPTLRGIGYLAAYNRSPAFTSNRIANGMLTMETTTGDRTSAVLQSSPDLKTWTDVAINDNPGYRWSIEQPIEAGVRSRFFRVRAE